MSDIDLDIKNYTIIDIIQLFKLDEDIDKEELSIALDKLIQIHPTNSGLSNSYFNFFLKAYKLLVKHYKYLIDLENQFINYDEDINHYPVIKRENTYVLNRKIITIHSEDRDISKWPYIHEFEISLPCILHDIVSIKLMNIQLPNNIYNFSNEYQNTKLSFKLLPTDSILQNGGNRNIYEFITLINNNNNYIITIPNGKYSSKQLCFEIENRLNKSVSDYLRENNLSSIDNPNPVVDYSYFKLYNDTVNNKIWFGNTLDNFMLTWAEPIDYSIKDSNMDNILPKERVWFRYTDWGLGSYLGYNKINYQGIKTETYLDVSCNTYKYLTPNTNSIDNNNLSGCSYYIIPPNPVNLYAKKHIFMEIDKYNSMDEIAPYSENTNNIYSNDYHGKYNNIFAKIPLDINIHNKNKTCKNNKNIILSNNSTLNNITMFDNPLEELAKLKFKFRYHDDNIVDFKGNNINFTLEIGMLLSEIKKDYKVNLNKHNTIY